jgi:STE24 endopeptidase
MPFSRQRLKFTRPCFGFRYIRTSVPLIFTAGPPDASAFFFAIRLAQFDKPAAMAIMAQHKMIQNITEHTFLAFMGWPFMGVAILIMLLMMWKLEFIASILNLKAFALTIPSQLCDVWAEDAYAKAREYSISSTKFSLIESTFSLALVLVFWFAGGFSWFDSLSRQWFAGSPILIGMVFLGMLFLGQYLLTLPLSIYDTFVIEEKFGFNKTTSKTYVIDQIKSLALAAVLGIPLIAAVLWIFLNVPNAWLWAWLLFSAFQLIMMWLAPAVILPLFNKFEPMPEGELRSAIEVMAKKCQFPISGLYIMDGSKRSTKANAFFTGFGKTKKIALFDTLLAKHDTAELVAILAHEIGHFRCKHIPQRLVASLLQSAVMFFLIGLATDPHGTFSRMLFNAFGVADISPHVGLVLFGLIFAPIGRLLGIVSNQWSRRHEFEADSYAAEHTGSTAPLMSALKKLSTDNLSHPTPHPLRVALDYSHPPLSQRLEALAGRMQ